MGAVEPVLAQLAAHAHMNDNGTVAVAPFTRDDRHDPTGAFRGRSASGR